MDVFINGFITEESWLDNKSKIVPKNVVCV